MGLDLITLINLTSCFVVLAIIYIRYLRSAKTINMFDPMYFFLGFIFLYAIAGQYNKIRVDDFSESIYLATSLASFLFFFSFLIFTLFTEPERLFKFRAGADFAKHRRLFFIAGFVSLMIGYVMLYYNYSRLGSFADIFFSLENRSDRNSKLTELRGNLPFSHFLFVGAMLILASFLLSKKTLLSNKSIKRPILMALAFTAPIILFYLVDGERTAILKYIVGAFFVCVAINVRKIIQLKPKYLVVLTIFFLTFSFLGNMRAYIGYSLFTGDYGPIERRLSGEYGEAGIALFIPKEFPAVNYTFNRQVYELQENGADFRYGSSYLDAFPYLFPRSIYDRFGLKKSGTIADNFGEKVRLEVGRERKMGFGMSPLAESFANFGFYGPIFFALVMVSFIHLIIYMLHSRSPLVVLWACMQTPALFIINRAAFASLFSYIAWVSLIFFLSYMAALIFDYLMPKLKRES